MKRSAPSSVYSNEDKSARFFEQRTLDLQSSNDRLEKELEKMGEKLDSLENRKNDLMQEVIWTWTGGIHYIADNDKIKDVDSDGDSDDDGGDR